jgi:ArsR family transcriptional regulator, arsenate/arsenite/antimonite-responsive transcriptional repressor
MGNEGAIAVFAALGNEYRFSIWRHLLAYGTDGLPAGVLGKLVGLSASALSFHLRGMTAARLLRQRRTRQQMVYFIDFETMAALRQILFPDAALTPESRSPSHDRPYAASVASRQAPALVFDRESRTQTRCGSTLSLEHLRSEPGRQPSTCTPLGERPSEAERLHKQLTRDVWYEFAKHFDATVARE